MSEMSFEQQTAGIRAMADALEASGKKELADSIRVVVTNMSWLIDRVESLQSEVSVRGQLLSHQQNETRSIVGALSSELMVRNKALDLLARVYLPRADGGPVPTNAEVSETVEMVINEARAKLFPEQEEKG